MEKRIRLIASDMDGTLLQEYGAKCSDELFELICRLEEKGVRFVAASGRQYTNLQRLFGPVDDKVLYLCETGALVMHLNQALLKRYFEDGLALELCHAVYEQPECEVLISGERTSYLIPKQSSFVTYIRDEVGNDITIIDKTERISEPILKVSFYTQRQYRDHATEELNKQFKDRCQIMTSGNEWVDFAPFGTNKGLVLAELGRQLGIEPEEMAAFGDNENDRSMLELVGHPYIMENCNPSIRNISGTRCRRVETELRKILNNLS